MTDDPPMRRAESLPIGMAIKIICWVDQDGHRTEVDQRVADYLVEDISTGEQFLVSPELWAQVAPKEIQDS